MGLKKKEERALFKNRISADIERRRRGNRSSQKKTRSWRGRERVYVLVVISVTKETSQSPITPYGLPVAASIEAAKVGQDPSGVSPKHPPVRQVYQTGIGQ